MVLGHEACGAVDATIKSVRDGSTLPGHLPSLVAALKPAVDAVQGQSGDLLTNAIKRNVTLNVDQLKNAAPTWVRLLPTTKSAWWGVFTS